MTLNEMSAEYLHNADLMERRVQELRERLRNLNQSEQYRVRRQINMMEQMISENRGTARYLARYYEKGEHPVEQVKKRGRGRPRGSKTHTGVQRRRQKSFISSYGRRADSAGVSGLCAVLSGRHDAKQRGGGA